MNGKLALAAVSILVVFFSLNYNSYLTDLSYYSSKAESFGADLTCGFTDDFKSFLNSNGYGSYGFERSDIKCGAYGGRSNSGDKINKTPVIFIHGNSDVGFGRGTADGYVAWQTGFRSLATFLSEKGYQK